MVMMHIPADQPAAQQLIRAIKGGDTHALVALLSAEPHLATCIVVEANGTGRSLLHILADAPGGRPRQQETLRILVDAGAELDATPVAMDHLESPLHWAASNDDVELIDALLDAGADIERPGSSIGGGSPIQSALGYGQYKAVRRLYERGAKVELAHLVVLGLTDKVRDTLIISEPAQEECDGALWNACRRGDIVLARLLVEHGANPGWVAPWSNETPLDVARAEGQHHLLPWLENLLQAK